MSQALVAAGSAWMDDGAPAPSSGPGWRGPCWVAVSDPTRAIELAQAMAAIGWRVDRVLDSVASVLAGLADCTFSPDLLVMSLRFRDGDGLHLIRSLPRGGHCPAICVVSHQQRAVIKAALKLAELLGVVVAGSAEEPVAAADVARRMMGFRATPGAASPAAEGMASQADAPLGRADLRSLLDSRGLQAWMQPQLRLKSREIVGFEALMRASDGCGGWITPDRLLPGLAEHGMLEDATLMMLQQAVSFVADCLGRGLAISTSVNASLSSMSDPVFCRALPEVVARAGLDPSWITIEVTETDALDDLAHVLENAARIRMLGFNLAIDDFGVAYSGLSQLGSIPFSELKLDRSFVQNLHLDPRKQAILRGCASLGQLLDLHVVAEGVETLLELEMVAKAGCTHVQGYLVSRPLPPGQSLAWLGRLSDSVWRPGI